MQNYFFFSCSSDALLKYILFNARPKKTFIVLLFLIEFNLKKKTERLLISTSHLVQKEHVDAASKHLSRSICVT